jgi:hypothetical protein
MVGCVVDRLGLKPKANSENQLKQVLEWWNSTYFNGFGLLAWDFNPRRVVRSTV